MKKVYKVLSYVGGYQLHNEGTVYDFGDAEILIQEAKTNYLEGVDPEDWEHEEQTFIFNSRIEEIDLDPAVAALKECILKDEDFKKEFEDRNSMGTFEDSITKLFEEIDPLFYISKKEYDNVQYFKHSGLTFELEDIYDYYTIEILDNTDQWYLKYYVCSECGTTWQDEHDCLCNDRCPNCDSETEVSSYTKID